MRKTQPPMKTTIIITKETREKLKALGRKGESYDQIINRLIALLQEQALEA